MAIVERIVDGIKRNFYIDDSLLKSIEKKWKPSVEKKDNDRVVLIDGPEGSGKSVLGQQIGIIIDPTLTIDRICMTPIEFREAVLKAKKGNVIIYDEAFTGLSSRGSLTEVNKMLVELMMEMRQKNLFVIIVMPTFFMLDKYVALFRAKGLFHVYLKNGARGRWVYFNKKSIKLLYLFGKKLYSYKEPKSNARGRFMDGYAVNEEEYRKKKKESLMKKVRATKSEEYKNQRDICVSILYKELGITQTELADLLNENGWKIKQNTLSEIIKAVRTEEVY